MGQRARDVPGARWLRGAGGRGGGRGRGHQGVEVQMADDVNNAVGDLRAAGGGVRGSQTRGHRVEEGRRL